MKNAILALGLILMSSNASALSGRGEMYNQRAYQEVNRCMKRMCALNDGGQSYIRECMKLRTARHLVPIAQDQPVFEVRQQGERCFCDCGHSRDWLFDGQ